MKKQKYFLIILLPILVIGCGKKSSDDSPVLAVVDGVEISEKDLNENLERLLGERQSARLDADTRQKALEGMVLSKVISNHASNELSKQKQEVIESKTNTYRENLLVNEYLKTHAEVVPVTVKMINEYYDRHKDRYGANTERRYEMIYTIEKLTQKNRDILLKRLKKSDSNKNWKTLVSSLHKKGLKTYYRQGSTEDELLNNQIKSLIKSLKNKDVSGVTFVDGRLYKVRITEEIIKQAQPISEAYEKIRNILKPVKIKEAIKKVSDELLKSANVEYINKGNK